jgi:hypothetical protein
VYLVLVSGITESKSPLKISPISASTRTRHACDHAFLEELRRPAVEVDYLNSHMGKRRSISHFNVGNMVSGESLKSSKILFAGTPRTHEAG